MRADREMLRGLGPSAVLHMLAGGEQTGYELARALARGGADVLPVGEGAAYVLLYQLQSRKLITSRCDETATPPQQLYSLTDKGHRQHQREQDQRDRLARIIGGST